VPGVHNPGARVKRGGPLRRTPLKRGGKIQRKAPLPRRSSTLKPKKPLPSKRVPAKARRVSDPTREEWEHLTRLILARSGGRCEIGGCNLHVTGLERHHRRLRSQGGEHTIENLLATCPHHHGVCHRRPAWARQRGYIVPGMFDHDPSQYAVMLHDGRTVRFTKDGGYDVVWSTPEEGNPDGTEH
jgi:hypothetical protein